MSMDDDPGFLDGLIGDGRPLLSLTGVALLISGGFALFLSARREFLPHDIAYLGLSADQLCALAQCRIVRFMFHDRVAFGGTLIAIAVLYLWLIAFPLRAGFVWAWWALAVSGALGFSSFLAYLGYGYLDTWHGSATLVLIPCFLLGLWRSRHLGTVASRGWLRTNSAAPRTARLGRVGLLATAAGMILAGVVIVTLGSTRVFVPQDLAFIGLDRADLTHLNPRLIPLIAHDRAGFGGGLLTIGVLVAFCSWFAESRRAFLQAILVAGSAGFGCAIGVHYVEGYTDITHLGPAWAGGLLFYCSLLLVWLGAARPASGTRSSPSQTGHQ